MLYRTRINNNYILLHIPHASLNIPPDDRGYFLLDDLALEKEVLFMTDLHMDRMCEGFPANMLISDVSRLVVDMERYEDDAEEGMARFGMGVAYTSAHDGSPLRIVEDDYRTELISKYYKPYHAELTAMCGVIAERRGKCVIVDMHSFPTKPMFCVTYPEVLPDICIGFNGDGDPLADFAKGFFEAKGYSVMMNCPYPGSMVPGGLEPLIAGKVESFMIEINRELYMDERTGLITDGFYAIQNHIADYIGELSG